MCSNPYISYKFSSFLMAVPCSILTQSTPNFRIFVTSMCYFWLCGSCVLYPIINRLVLSPSLSQSVSHSLIHSFIHSFIDSLIHSLIHPLIHSLIHSLIHWFIHWFIDSFIHSFIDWLNDWLTNWLIDWLIDWLTDWLTGICHGKDQQSHGHHRHERALFPLACAIMCDSYRRE